MLMELTWRHPRVWDLLLGNGRQGGCGRWLAWDEARQLYFSWPEWRDWRLKYACLGTGGRPGDGGITWALLCLCTRIGRIGVLGTGLRVRRSRKESRDNTFYFLKEHEPAVLQVSSALCWAVNKNNSPAILVPEYVPRCNAPRGKESRMIQKKKPQSAGGRDSRQSSNRRVGEPSPTKR